MTSPNLKFRPARTARCVSVALMSAGLLAGCGATEDGVAASSASSSTSSATASTPDRAVACSARVRLNANVPPGIDPDSPAPSPQQMKDWAASVSPDFETLATNVPADLAPQIKVQRADLEKAEKGMRLDALDPASSASGNAIDEFVFEQCGFPRLDVISEDGKYGQIPSTFTPGPVAIRFATRGAASTAAFVLLVARVKDGSEVSLQDLTSQRVDITQLSDVAAGILPNGDQPGYGTADLKPGRYVLASPLGDPPQFAGGVIAAEFTTQ